MALYILYLHFICCFWGNLASGFIADAFLQSKIYNKKSLKTSLKWPERVSNNKEYKQSFNGSCAIIHAT